MIPNINPETGVHFGIIACNSLDGDMLHTLLYEKGKDLSYAEAVEEEKARQFAEFIAAKDVIDRYGTHSGIEFWPDLNNFDPQIEEPVIEGTHEGVHYRTTWLGGAQLLFIFDSPHRVLATPCSPCVPNAGDLDHVALTEEALAGAVLTYDVPADWRA